MDKKELGHLIKEARLAKKMTQSEVVGTFITRNMLSQIESGTAIPSIKTLQYLSERLDISIQMLSSEEQAEKDNVENAGGNYSLYRVLESAKQSVTNGTPVEAVEALAPYINTETVYSDEIFAVYSIACLAASRLKDLSSEQAVQYATEAVFYADRGFYASHERKTEAMLLVEKLKH